MAAHVVFNDPDRGILVLLNEEDKWMLPGGKIDKDDYKFAKWNIDDGIRHGVWRELMEESGYKATEENLEHVPGGSRVAHHELFYYKAGRRNKPINWDKIFKTRKSKGESRDYAFVVEAGTDPRNNKIRLAVLDKNGNFIKPVYNARTGKLIKPKFRWASETIPQLQTALESTYFKTRLTPKDRVFRNKQRVAKDYYYAKDKLQLQLARPRPAGVPAVQPQVDTAAACPAPTVTDYANAEFMRRIASAAFSGALSGFVLGSAALMGAQYYG